MLITIYKDQLVSIGMRKEEDCEGCNIVDVDVPEEILRSWYYNRLSELYEGDFEWWYREESMCDDMDGFFQFTDWRPEEKDLYNEWL